MAHTETIIAAGGVPTGYTTIQTWEDGRDGVLDGIETGECGAEVFAAVTFSGAAADATNYMHLTSGSGFEHDGRAHEVSAAGNARIEINANTIAVTCRDEFTRISWLEFSGPGDYSQPSIWFGTLGAGTLHLNHCIIHNNLANEQAVNAGVILSDADGEFRSYRNIIYGFDLAGIRADAIGANSAIYNNTVYQSEDGATASFAGIRCTDSDGTIKNNFCADNDMDLYLTGAGAVDNNASTDSTGDADLDDLTATDEAINPTTTWADTDLLIKAGAILVEDKTEADIDLSPESLEKDTIINFLQ